MYICLVQLRVHYLLNTGKDVCTFAHYSIQLCVHLPMHLPRYSSLKIHKSIVGTSPRYRFQVTMEPVNMHIKFFDTKLQMFESLNFVREITTSQIDTSENIRRL